MIEPGATVVLAVDAGALGRWVIWLAEALEKQFRARVSVTVAESPADSSALATLLSLEALLLRPGRQGGADRMSRGELAGRFPAASASRADVVIDLTAEGIETKAARLRPLYNGHAGENALAAALFFEGTPSIVIERFPPGADRGQVVAHGVASLEAAAGIGGGIEAVSSRVITLILKALSSEGGSGVPGAAAGATGKVRAIGRKDVLLHSAKSVARQAVRAAYRLCCHGSHWRVGWRFAEPGQDVWSRRDLGGVGWNVLADPVDHFYADPFPFHWKGRDFLFFEDLDYKTGKGVISVVTFDATGRPGPTTTVLEEPWHLSYPFLIEWNGDVWMIPESSANRDIAIYRAVDFPLKWERHAVLLSGIEAADATIIDHQGLLWMFAVVRDGVGGYSDTLALWSATDLFGPWRAHPGNPVLVDDRVARPAGNMVHSGGKLYRPVQDCRHAYGAALNFMRVTRLDETGFDQQLEGAIGPGPAWPGRRLHTLNYNGRLEAIDGFVVRPRLKPAADLVDSWFKPKV